MGWPEDRARLLAWEPTEAIVDAAGADVDDDPPCESSRPCSEVMDCCAHGGVCEVQEHGHFDSDEYFDTFIQPAIETQRARMTTHHQPTTHPTRSNERRAGED